MTFEDLSDDTISDDEKKKHILAGKILDSRGKPMFINVVCYTEGHRIQLLRHGIIGELSLTEDGWILINCCSAYYFHSVQNHKLTLNDVSL